MKTKRKEKFTIRWVARLVLIAFMAVIALCVFCKKTRLVAFINMEEGGTWQWKEVYGEVNIEHPYILFTTDSETAESTNRQSIMAYEKEAKLRPTTIFMSSSEAYTFHYTYPEELECFGELLEQIRTDPAATIYARESLGIINPSAPEETASMVAKLENMSLSDQIEVSSETIRTLLRKLDGGRIRIQN